MVLHSDNSESDDDYEKAQLAKEREKEHEVAHYAKRKSPGDDVVEDYKGDGAYVNVTSEEEVSSTAIAKGKGKQKEQPRKPPVQPSTMIVEPVAHKGKSKSRQKHRAKAKAVDNGDSDDGGHTSSDDDDLATAGFSSTIPGALSQTQKEQLNALQAQQEAEVAGLAESFGKNTNVLEQYLGRRSHMVKEKGGWTLWQAYYVTPDVEGGGHIKPEGMSSKDFNCKSHAAYKKAAKLSDEDLKNPDLIKAALPWLFKWHEQTVAAVLNTWKDTGKFRRIVQKAVKPIVDQAEVVGRQMGIDVMGYVIDPSGRASFAFGSGPRFERVKTQYKLVLQRSLKDQEHIFGTTQIELDAIAMGDDMPPVVLKSAGTSQDSHDANRQQFGELVHGIIGKVCVQNMKMTTENARAWKMKWGAQWADFAWENQLCMVNWYKKLEDKGHVLGKNVAVGKIRAKTLCDVLPGLVKKYSRREDEDEDEDDDDDTSAVLKVESWMAEEKAIPPALQHNIPLVVSEDGRELVQVKHSAKWKKATAAADTKALEKAEKESKKTASRKNRVRPPLDPRPSCTPLAATSRAPLAVASRIRPQDELQSQRHTDDPSRAPLPVAAHPRVTEDRRSHQHAGNPAHSPLHAATRLRMTKSRPDAGDPLRAHLHIATRPLTATRDRAADRGMNTQLLGWLKIEGNHPSLLPREPSQSRKRKREVSQERIDDEDRGEGPSSMNTS
ncbi:hypothetical protein C8J57DRAFT_1529839 [Mycena rebaudengoi]|nr:hypothetical protein C8J57DRAFT_1529839 [Mycena rebaudengoi]